MAKKKAAPKKKAVKKALYRIVVSEEGPFTGTLFAPNGNIIFSTGSQLYENRLDCLTAIRNVFKAIRAGNITPVK